MSVDHFNQQINWLSTATSPKFNHNDTSQHVRMMNPTWNDEGTPLSSEVPTNWNKDDHYTQQQFPNYDTHLDNIIKATDDCSSSIHSNKTRIFQTSSDHMEDFSSTSQIMTQWQPHNSYIAQSVEEFKIFLLLNGSLIDNSNPVSNWYEQYSEKHLQYSFPLPFCVLSESIESFLSTSYLELFKDVVRRNIVLNESTIACYNSSSDASEPVVKQQPITTTDPHPTSSSSQNTFQSGLPTASTDHILNFNTQILKQTQPSSKRTPDDKAKKTQSGDSKKTRKNSMKKSLATQFHFHHFHESTPLIIQSSPTPSPTDNKNPFKLHHQDKHNLQTQQTGNSGTLSKWKYR